MAQVIKKYSAGTPSVQPTTKLGSVIIDGKKYDVTDEWLKSVENHSEQGSAWAQHLRSGEDRYLYRTPAGGFNFADTVEDVTSVNDRQERKLGQSGRGGRKVRGIKQAYNDFGNWLVKNLPTKPEPSKFEIGNTNITYLTGEDGKKYLNETAKADIDRHFANINKGITDKYDEYIWWDKNTNKDMVADYISRVGTQLQEALKNGTATEADIANAKALGFTFGKQNGATPTKSGNLGFANNETVLSVANPDGSLSIKEDHPLYTYLTSNELKGKNLWFNDQFRAIYPQADLEEDLFYINGKLYKANSPELKKLKEYNDFVRRNSQNQLDNELIHQYWGSSRGPWAVSEYDNNYLPYAKNSIVQNVTGHYEPIADAQGNPLNIMRVVSQNAERDVYGHPIMKDDQLVVIDANGNVITGVTPTKAASARNYDNVVRYSQYHNSPFTDSEQNPYVKTIMAFGHPDNTVGLAQQVWQDPTTEKYYYHDVSYDDRIEPGSGMGTAGNYAVELPAQVVNMLKQNPHWIQNNDLRKKFNAIVYNYLRKNPSKISLNPNVGGYNIHHKYMPEHISNPELFPLLEALAQQDLKQAGYKIVRKQIGGSFIPEVQTSVDNVVGAYKTDTKTRVKGESKTFGDGTELTTADKAEIASLLLDTAGFAASFVPVYGNIAGAVAGVGGTIAQAISDIKRDGFDMGDLASLGLNLGFDAATLFSGAIGKSGKLAKSLIKSNAVAKAIGVAISAGMTGVAGMSLADSWDRLKKGEWKVEDLRNILNVVRGLSGTVRMAGSATTKGELEGGAKAKIGDSEATITKAEWDRIQKLPKSQQKAELEKLLPKKDMSYEDAKKAVIEARKATKPDITDAELNKNLDKAVKQYIKDNKVASELSDVGITYKSGDKWYQVERLNFKPEFETPSRVYLDPEKVPWYKPWDKYAATMDARVNVNNPYHAQAVRIPTDANAQWRWSHLGPSEVKLTAPDGSTMIVTRELFDQVNASGVTPLQRNAMLRKAISMASAEKRIAQAINEQRKAAGKKPLSGKSLQTEVEKFLKARNKVPKTQVKDFGISNTGSGIVFPEQVQMGPAYTVRGTLPITFRHVESWNSDEPAKVPSTVPYYFYKKGGVIKKCKRGAAGGINTDPSNWDLFKQGLKNVNWQQGLNDLARFANVGAGIENEFKYDMEEANAQGIAMQNLLNYHTEIADLTPHIQKLETQKNDIDSSLTQHAKMHTDQKLAGNMFLAGSKEKTTLTENTYRDISNTLSDTSRRNTESKLKIDLENSAREHSNKLLAADVRAQRARAKAKRANAWTRLVGNFLQERGQRRVADDAERTKALAAASTFKANRRASELLSKASGTPEQNAAYRKYLQSALGELQAVAGYNNSFGRASYMKNSPIGDYGADGSGLLDFSTWLSQQKV